MGSKVFKNIKKIAFTALMCSIFAAVFSEYAFAAETCYKSTELNKIIYKAGLDICNNNAEETKFCVDNVSKVVDKTGKIGKDVDPAILQNFINHIFNLLVLIDGQISHFSVENRIFFLAFERGRLEIILNVRIVQYFL